MQPPIRVHSSHDTEQGDIDCFHFTGVIWDWHIMKAQQGSENKEKSIYASKQSLFTISCKFKKKSIWLYFQKYPFLPFRLINSSLIFLLSDCWWIIGYLVPKETPTQTHKIVNRLLFDLEKSGSLASIHFKAGVRQQSYTKNGHLYHSYQNGTWYSWCYSSWMACIHEADVTKLLQWNSTHESVYVDYYYEIIKKVSRFLMNINKKSTKTGIIKQEKWLSTGNIVHPTIQILYQHIKAHFAAG